MFIFTINPLSLFSFFFFFLYSFSFVFSIILNTWDKDVLSMMFTTRTVYLSHYVFIFTLIIFTTNPLSFLPISLALFSSFLNQQIKRRLASVNVIYRIRSLSFKTFFTSKFTSTLHCEIERQKVTFSY